MSLAHPIVTLILTVLALLSVFATVGAIRRLRHLDQPFRASGRQRLFVAVIGVTTLILFIYFWLGEAGWQPVTSHRDGLLLMSCLLSSVIFFIQHRARLAGLSAFALPVLTFLLAWAICASGPTYYPFELTDLHPVWRGVHLAGVYMGTACCGVAAMAGCMYLYVQKRLKRKDSLGSLGRLASLEALENLIIRTAMLGFVLLTVGLVSGVIVISEENSRLTADWWYAPKIALSTLAWLVYALLMNVRYASGFRGRRAAWLSIFGLSLLLATYVLVTSLPTTHEQPDADPASAAVEDTNVQPVEAR